MAWRDILLVVHIAAVATWLGANMVQAATPTLAAREGPQMAAAWYRITLAFTPRLYVPAGVIVLISGVFLVLDSEQYGFGEIFVAIGFAMVVIGALVGSFIIEPATKNVITAVESGEGERIRRAVARLSAAGTFDTLLLLLTIYAMVAKL